RLSALGVELAPQLFRVFARVVLGLARLAQAGGQLIDANRKLALGLGALVLRRLEGGGGAVSLFLGGVSARGELMALAVMGLFIGPGPFEQLGLGRFGAAQLVGARLEVALELGPAFALAERLSLGALEAQAQLVGGAFGL